MKPDGKQLVATLIKLLEEQEGVKITYTFEEPEGEKEKTACVGNNQNK